ncbi:PIG-L deacetylase family protein [Fontivita pretiosa]|uniref:PIG-L deacetylase family protein n=1 Tax=Fontivita pretiosa TaxID=2989684 RepID=UPI003D1650D3
MNVLVLAAHPDDEAIGCGGQIALHAQARDRVTVAFLTSGEFGLAPLPPQQARHIRESEARAAARLLGICQLDFLRLPDAYLSAHIEQAANQLAPLLELHRPDRIYLPHPDDGHPDHRCAIDVLRAALARATSTPPPQLLGYEIWTALAGYDQVVDITAVMVRKLRAIRQYRSQLSQIRYDRAVRGLNQYRGIVAAKSRFAEVFALLNR